MTLAYGTNEPQWVATTLPEQKQQMVAYLDWEQNATRVIAARVAARLGRKHVVTKQNPAEFLVLLGRAALHQGIGGRQVMIGQLTHLLEMAARPNVEIRIVPDDRGWHPGLEGAFTFIESTEPSPRETAPKHPSCSWAFASQSSCSTRRATLMPTSEQSTGSWR